MIMPLRVQTSRGLAKLRTLTGRSAERLPSYKAYKAFLRVTLLELERARHSQEIETAKRRLDVMLARCREIEAEKAATLADAGVTPPAVGTPGDRSGEIPGPQPQRGFRFSY
jgi:hypothetical protein